jgi:hypothetical protein
MVCKAWNCLIGIQTMIYTEVKNADAMLSIKFVQHSNIIYILIAYSL